MTTQPKPRPSAPTGTDRPVSDRHPSPQSNHNLVSKTNIVDYDRCPYGFWLMETGAVKREDVFGPVERGLLDAGVAHENRLLAAVPVLPAGLSESEIREQARFLYGGETVINLERQLIGRPDGIDLESHAPIEIKNHLRVQTRDRLELAFYWRLLEPSRVVRNVAPHGWLMLGLGTLEEVKLTNRHFTRVDELIAAVRIARTTGVKPLPCDCIICHDRPDVLEIKHCGTDVGLIWGLGPARANGLRNLGIRDVASLAEADPDILAAQSRECSGPTLSPTQIVEWQYHARALRDQAPQRISEARFEHDAFIALDLEYVSGGDNLIWLVGTCAQRDGEVEVQQSLCESKPQLQRALRKFDKLLDDNDDVPIVTWNGDASDILQLRSASRGKHRRMRTVERRHVDLYKLTRESLRLPIPRLDLKSVGRYLGVERRSEIGNGFAAIAVFERYISSSDAVERRQLRKELLDYNREDLEALRAVANFLRTV